MGTMKDLINPKTRLQLRELMTSMSLREIDDEFMAVGLRPDDDFNPSVSGQRRGRVEQHYHAMNFLNPQHARAFILLCENFLTDNPSSDDTKVLLRWLERDGYMLREGALVAIAPSHHREQLEAAAGQLGAVHLGDLLTRMREALGHKDPDLVIGTSKGALIASDEFSEAWLRLAKALLSCGAYMAQDMAAKEPCEALRCVMPA